MLTNRPDFRPFEVNILSSTYRFKLSDAISHAANGTESTKRQNAQILSLEVLPDVVWQTAVLQERPHATLASKKGADTVGSLVAEVDDGVQGGTYPDV